MHDVTTFQYHSHAFRSVQDGEELYFVAKDVCQALELSDVSMACQNLPEDEKLVQALLVSGQSRRMLCVTESGLYRLIFRSNKPAAEKFRRWVFHEVLPTIRKTGSYAVRSEELMSGGAEMVPASEVLALYRDTKALLEEHNSMLRLQLAQERSRITKRVNFTPDEDAQVIRLRRQGYSHREIGMVIGRKKDSVGSCLRRLRKAGIYTEDE